MLDRIINILNTAKDISDWKIIQTQREANELFLIKKQIDMPRSKKVNSISVTIYKDFEEDGNSYRGSSTVNIHPTMSDEEAATAIKDAAFAASFVKNPYYPLPDKSPVGNLSSMDSKFRRGSLVEWMPKIKEALYQEDCFQNGYINSTEIFLSKSTITIVNSKGIQMEYSAVSGQIEFITSWKEQGEEIELYKELIFSDYLPDNLANTAKEMLEMSREKAIAKPTPALGSATVILQGEPVAELLKYYYSQSNAQSVYQHVSTAKPMESIQGQEIKGDKITLTLHPALANSTESSPVDEDGFVLEPHRIIENGILKKYWGTYQYSHYLNVEPTGRISNIIVECGSKSIDEMRAEPYLEIAAFSDFSMSTMTGDFAGEIRLGWYFDGKTRTAVSGGSISGNLRNMQTNMFLSREIQQCTAKEGFQNMCFKGPKALMMYNVSVAGN